MSDRLALSASMSVLMMAIYVLFGADAAHAPLGPEALDAPMRIDAADVSFEAGHLLPIAR